MKSVGSIGLALVLGFILGTLFHVAPVRADSSIPISVDKIVSGGLKISSKISGSQVVGFSCGPAESGMGSDCYALSTK
jgi:hypothetical protein